jgi:type I restriction enzyme M protein
MPTPSTALVVPDGKIVDYVDGKFRADTPEEYVRQNIEKRLLNELRYPRELIAIEYGLKVGSSRTRADVVIFLEDRAEDQDGVGIVVECKKESVSPSDKKEGVSQLKSYMSACLNCEWGLWTNGKQREVWRKVLAEDGKRDFVEYSDIPVFNGNVDDLDRPTRASLKDAVGDNLLYAFKAAHNSIHVIDGFQKEQAFFELLKIIFCKIFDERNITKPLDFYVTSAERASGDGQLACKHRINAIFESVKDRYSQIFESSDEIKLNPRSLVRIVAESSGENWQPA